MLQSMQIVLRLFLLQFRAYLKFSSSKCLVDWAEFFMTRFWLAVGRFGSSMLSNRSLKWSQPIGLEKIYNVVSSGNDLE